MHVHAERFDVTLQGYGTALVELHGHEAGRGLDDMRNETQLAQRVCGLEAKQTTTNDCAHAASTSAHVVAQ